jgi:hypothetical protein
MGTVRGGKSEYRVLVIREQAMDRPIYGAQTLILVLYGAVKVCAHDPACVP